MVELTSSFDCYGQLLLHDISRFIQWLRFPLDIVDSYALKRTLQFWCNALLHFTQDSETQRIVFRLLKMGLFSKVNDVLHATADYYQKGHHEREQLQLLLQINKLFVYLLDCFNRWVDLETSSVGYLEDVNSLLQSLLTAVDSFATFSHETLRENLNCLHILVIFLDRIATAEGTRVTCSTSNWLVRNIISKKTWFQSAMKEYFELLLNRQEDYLFETGCSFHSHWESLLSLFITLIAFGPKKNQHLVDMFPKSLVYWRNAIFACYRFPSYQRPLLVVVTNLLFACIARARAYQWEWEASLAEDVDNDAILYHFCNQIFSSHTLIEISAYRAMEAWILSLRAVDEPLKRRTTVEAVKRCLGIKLVQDTPLLVWAPRLSLVACFFEIVDHDWLSESYWESMLLHVTQKRGVGPIQMECMQHMIRSLEFAPRGCLEKFLPILMQTIHDLENENTYQAKVGCPILVDDTVLTPVVYQWQQDFCIKKDIQSLFQHNK